MNTDSGRTTPAIVDLGPGGPYDEPPEPTGWVALAGQLFGNLEDCETVYAWDHRYYDTKADAIKAGFLLADDTDDFNVGRVEDGHLVWFGWMDEKHPVEDYPAVAEQFGWQVSAGEATV